MGRCAEILLDPVTGLTPKQKLFAKSFLQTQNAAEAASVAYNPNNRDTAHSMGSETLRNPAVLAVIEEAYRKEGITEDWARLRTRQYVDRGISDPKYASPGVAALGKAMQHLGMIKDSGSGDVNNLTVNILQLGAGEIEKRSQALADRLLQLQPSSQLPIKPSNTPPA